MPWEMIVILIVFPLMLAAAGTVYWKLHSAEQRRHARVAEYARGQGWAYERRNPGLSAEHSGVPPFSSGSRPQFDDVVHHSGGNDWGHAFEFSFGIGPKNREFRHYQHVITLRLPAALPPMSLRPQYATDSLGIALGLQDIQFESQEFNDAWLIRGASGAAVHDLIHPRAMEWLMEPRNRGLTLGISGHFIFLAIPGRAEAEHIPGAAARLLEFTRMIPRYVWDRAAGRS